MLTVLFPLAGSGQRFTDAGYSDPKPLIPICGKPMVDWAVESVLRDLGAVRLIFVVRDMHASGNRLTQHLWDRWHNTHPVTMVVNAPAEGTQGAACTCLLARHRIIPELPLLIANCDQIVSPQAVKALCETDGDAAILTMLGDGTRKWSYAKFSDGDMTAIAEKEPISDRATCGLYWWKKGEYFINSVLSMITKTEAGIDKARVNGEYYVAPAFNYMQGRIREVRVEEHGGVFVGLGTPEDVKAFVDSQMDKMSIRRYQHPISGEIEEGEI